MNDIVIINESLRIQIRANCKSPNANCRRAFKGGNAIHAIPMIEGNAYLVMPSYHFASRDDAIAAIENAYHNAITIESDEMLYASRESRIAHYIPKGYIDPSRR